MVPQMLVLVRRKNFDAFGEEQQWKVTVLNIYFSVLVVKCSYAASHCPASVVCQSGLCFHFLTLHSSNPSLARPLCASTIRRAICLMETFLWEKTVTSVLAVSESALTLSWLRMCDWVRKVSGVKWGNRRFGLIPTLPPSCWKAWDKILPFDA